LSHEYEVSISIPFDEPGLKARLGSRENKLNSNIPIVSTCTGVMLGNIVNPEFYQITCIGYSLKIPSDETCIYKNVHLHILLEFFQRFVKIIAHIF